jgi:hypothetical protein
MSNEVSPQLSRAIFKMAAGSAQGINRNKSM